VQDRRATCQCRCGNLRTLFVAAIADGTAPSSCGCSARTAGEEGAMRREVAQYKQWREQKRLRPESR
jgi:hypothetical protein